MQGLYAINKPGGVTSRHVVDAVAGALGTPHVGHAGTLDPLATGLLVLCAGGATRLVPYIQHQPKTYLAEFVLGCDSDTDDITGSVTHRTLPELPTVQTIQEQLPGFLGAIEQVPPQFSAVRIRGRRAHELARRGRQVRLQPRIVEVHRLELLSYAPPRLELLVHCGSGTYVRALGRDLGQRLGCGAILSRLSRTAIGPFLLEKSLPFEDVSAATLARQRLPLRWAVPHLPGHTASPHELCELVQGRCVPWQIPEPGVADASSKPLLIAVFCPRGELAAICEYRTEPSRLKPHQVFVDREETLQHYGNPPVAVPL